MAMMAAGTPIALQAQGNGVTIVVNDGSQTANSISGVVYSEEDNEPLIGVQVRIVGANVATITDVNGKFNFQLFHPKEANLYGCSQDDYQR